MVIITAIIIIAITIIIPFALDIATVTSTFILGLAIAIVEGFAMIASNLGGARVASTAADTVLDSRGGRTSNEAVMAA